MLYKVAFYTHVTLYFGKYWKLFSEIMFLTHTHTHAHAQTEELKIQVNPDDSLENAAIFFISA